MNRTGGKVQFAARFVFMRLFVVCKFVYSYQILFYVITVVHSYFHRRCKASSVFLFYSEKYSPLGRPGKSSRGRGCPQVLPVFLAEKPCGQPRPRL